MIDRDRLPILQVETDHDRPDPAEDAERERAESAPAACVGRFEDLVRDRTKNAQRVGEHFDQFANALCLGIQWTEGGANPGEKGQHGGKRNEAIERPPSEALRGGETAAQCRRHLAH